MVSYFATHSSDTPLPLDPRFTAHIEDLYCMGLASQRSHLDPWVKPYRAGTGEKQSRALYGHTVPFVSDSGPFLFLRSI